ncbi:hypothetical protein O6H91_12G078900 [Diphasiastrum complanatum]|uniref:Uncharacterized protein n=1 Tax=Diphasiastrum complanatum TaxID=34168 RepID=A0ACC2C3W5_DIPCM|nr:hypothetical protein O6H91_12G078900 [Diphasiastrum complanatum]
MSRSEAMHRMLAWDNEKLQSFPEASRASACVGGEEMDSAAGHEGGSSPRGDTEKGAVGCEGNWSAAGPESMQRSSEEEKKLSDLCNKLWRSPSWGSHSAPSSPRYVHPRTEHKSSHQSIPFPLTPHPQQSARQRPAMHKPLGDERKDWAPPTPGRRREMSRIRNGLDIKLDLGAVQRSRDAGEPTETQLKRDKFAFFDKDCSRVADHIYIGSDAVARNRETLLANKITHVLNCVGFVCPECFPDDFKYKTLWLQDSPCEDITSILYDVFDYFEEVRELGGRVFVHCCQGVSRSTSLVIAYLMWRKGRSFEDAFQDVKAARGVTNPNMGFACQLLQCQKRVHAAPASPNSVLRMYRMAPHSHYDPLHLVPKTVSNPGVAALDSRGAFVVHVPSAIFVWVGKRCEAEMTTAANIAASQVVKYERAQGKISLIPDGNEPAEFWESLNKGFGSAEDSDSTFADSIIKSALTASENKVGGILGAHSDREKNVQQVDPGQQHTPREIDCSLEKELQPQFNGQLCESDRGMRIVKGYDVDYDVYRRALEGGVVPPANGLATHVPARDSGWSRIRREVLSGSMRERLTPQAASCEISSQSLGSTNMKESNELSETTSSRIMTLADPFRVQDVPSLSVGSSVSKLFAPSPSFSTGSTSSPCFTTSDTPSGESSFSESPSSSELLSPAFSFSFSNPIRIDHSPIQPDSKPLSKAPPLSLAQRRGSAPPSLRLPALIDDPSTPKGPFKSPSLPSSNGYGSLQLTKKLPNFFGSMNSDFEQGGSHCISENQSSEGTVTPESEGSVTRIPRTGLDASARTTWQKLNHFSNSKQKTQPEMYAWPSMEKVDLFDAGDLDSQAAFVLVAPSGRHPKVMPEADAHVYIWVGKNMKETKEIAFHVEDVDNQQSVWEKVGKDFLERSRLQVDMPIKVVKEGLEPDDFWELFVNG